MLTGPGDRDLIGACSPRPPITVLSARRARYAPTRPFQRTGLATTSMTKTTTKTTTDPTPITPIGDIPGGVDTHLDSHVAAAKDSLGRTLGTQAFPTTRA